MKIINSDDAQNRNLQPLGKKHPVRAAIEKLKVKECLTVSPQEFTWKTHTLNYFCKEITRQTGKKFIVHKDIGTKGWVVERVE